MPADFRTALAGYIAIEARPFDKYGHQPRLEALTRKIGAGCAGNVDYDADIVFAAAWLHDLGVFIGHRPEDPEHLSHWDHVSYACEQAPQILRDSGFPEEKIPAVLEVMRQHQPKDEPLTMEAVILRDADILEQLGAVGILRAVAKVGRDTRYARFSDVMPVLQRCLNDLPGKIRLEITRQLAEPRIQILKEFLRATEDEAGADLF
jgi:uncharacterized protein